MDDSKIIIDLIRESDLLQLSSLYEQLTGKCSDDEKSRIVLKRILNNHDYILMGARHGDELVASLMGVFCDDLVGECRQFVVLENFIVKDGYRGLGIGRRLLKSIEEIAAQKGCYYIMFVSGNSKIGAHEFYDKMGYSSGSVKGFKKILINEA